MIHARNTDWNSILYIAHEADTALASCTSLQRRLKYIYVSSYRRACRRGFRGSKHDWQIFVRIRGK